MNDAKENVVYAMEYYSALKRSVLLSYVNTQMNLEGMAQSEISQTQDKYYVIPLIWSLK